MLKSMNFFSGKSRGRAGGGTKLASLAPVILGLVPRIFWLQGTNLVNKLALLLHKCRLREDSWDKPKNDWCWERGFGTFSQSGRSMIEMLGVLAIIGVLSVGGIAGYSKAMEKFKINKAIEEYSYLIQGLVEHLHEIKYLSHDDTQIPIYEYIQAAHLIPETWKLLDPGLTDANGNTIYVFSQNDNLTVNFYLGGITNTTGENVTTSFSDKLCVALFQNLGQPLHEAVTLARTSKWGHGSKVIFFYGDAYCGGDKKCLKDATLSEMKEACGICDNTNSWCNFTLEF